MPLTYLLIHLFIRSCCERYIFTRYFITMRDANKHILRISHWIRTGMGHFPIVTRHCPIDQKYVSDSLSIMDWSRWNYACSLCIMSGQTRFSFHSSNISVSTINPWFDAVAHADVWWWLCDFPSLGSRSKRSHRKRDRRRHYNSATMPVHCQLQISNVKFVVAVRHWCHKLRQRWGITRRNSTENEKCRHNENKASILCSPLFSNVSVDCFSANHEIMNCVRVPSLLRCALQAHKNKIML